MTGTEKAVDVARADAVTDGDTAEAEDGAVEAAVEGWDGGEASLSMVAQFDQLTRNQRVLTAAEAEEMFLKCLAGGGSLRRAEGAEAEGARLALELAQSAEHAGDLEVRLEETRRALQEETDLRRRMERDRDQLAHRFEDVRRLVAAGELPGQQTPLREKMVRILGGRETLLPAPTSLAPSDPGPRSSRSGARVRGSWSPPRLLDRRLGDPGSGGGRRSRSAGGGSTGVISAGHLLEQARPLTVLSGSKCGGCSGRLRFGKAMVRCSACRLVLHPACAALVPTACPAQQP